MKILKIGLLVFLGLIALCVMAVAILWLTDDTYFDDMANHVEMKEHILGQFILNETTAATVQAAIESGIFGPDFSCDHLYTPTFADLPSSGTGRVICKEPSLEWEAWGNWYFIDFHFENYILVGLENGKMASTIQPHTVDIFLERRATEEAGQ